jgi:osmotically-inducible protein OsmY
MKTFPIAFLLGVIAGAIAVRMLSPRERRTDSHTALPSPAASSPAANLPETARSMRDSVADKLEAWKLTPENIKDDLAKTGGVVRSKAIAAGERIADARVTAVVKAKYVLDADLSAIDIGVECKDGEVTLTGTVASPGLIGRAIALALDTNGVRHVVSKLAVQPR